MQTATNFRFYVFDMISALVYARLNRTRAYRLPLIALFKSENKTANYFL